jgi:hypothetical protein
LPTLATQPNSEPDVVTFRVLQLFIPL